MSDLNMPGEGPVDEQTGARDDNGLLDDGDDEATGTPRTLPGAPD